MLKNGKHELFAQALAQGKTADESYAEAGFNPHRGNASRLSSNESIQARVAELRERAIRGIVLDRQWVLDRLIENATAALVEKDRSVANRSLELLGKELGMFVDRKEIRSGPLDEASPDELDRLREELISERARRAAERNGTTPSGKPN